MYVDRERRVKYISAAGADTVDEAVDVAIGDDGDS